MPKKILNIYEYENYRTYLRDFFAVLKQRDAHFTQRFFARKAGFSSHSFLPAVINGRRNLSPKAVEQVAVAHNLSERETSYFRELVGYTQARTESEREQRFKQMNAIRRNTRFYQLRRHQYNYFDEWYYPVIRELATIADWHGDYALLGSLCRPKITGTEARKAVEALVGMQLIVPENDRYVQTDTVVIAEDFPKHLIRKARAVYMKKAIDASAVCGPDESNFSAATLALSEEQFKKLSDMLDTFHRDAVAAASDTERAEKVYQLNIQLFPLSGKTQEDR